MFWRKIRRAFSLGGVERKPGERGEVYGCQAPSGEPQSLCDTVIERVTGMVTESAAQLNEQIRKERSAAEKKREHEEWLAGIKARGETLAKAKEAELLKGKTDLINRYVGEHLTDIKGYSFACARYGDFLSVNIARGGRHLSQTLNIAGTRGIELKQGWEPACNGKVYYRPYRQIEGGYSYSNGDPKYQFWDYDYDGVKGYIHKATLENLRVEALPPRDLTLWVHEYSEAGRYRPLLIFKKESKKDSHPRWDDDVCIPDALRDRIPDRCQLITEDYPRPAKDDEIIFEGIGATLFVPAGLGAGVYAQILKAPDTLKAKKR